MKNARTGERKEKEAEIDTLIAESFRRGYRKAFFPIDKSDVDYEYFRALYEANGYRIVPTGYIGGVWQLTEDICW